MNRVTKEVGKPNVSPEEKLQNLLQQGVLKSKKDVQKLYFSLRKSNSESKRPDFLTSYEKFEEKVDQFIWTKETLAALEAVVGIDLPLEKFHQYHRYIPKDWVEEKARWLTGSTNQKGKKAVSFMRGIGKIAPDDNLRGEGIKFPDASFKLPFDTGVKNPNWDVDIINGANIGTKHKRVIRLNPVRCALANARRNKVDAVVLSNVINFNFLKAGGLNHVLKALISGLNTSIELLEPSYQGKARRILENLPDNEVIYETTAEAFANVMSGVRKICWQPEELGGGPEFPGPHFLFLGYNDERIIASSARWALNYLTFLAQQELDAEIKAVKSARGRAKHNKKQKEAEKLSVKLRTLANERSRTVISYIRDQDRERFYNKVRSFVIRKFEEVIPNCKVIGMRTKNYLKFGDEVVEFNIPSHTQVTDTLLADFTDHYAPQVLKGKFPRVVVICHPFALNFRMTVREVDAKGKRGSSNIYVAPIAIDDQFLRKALEHTLGNPHPLARAISRWQFQPGVMRLTCRHGIISTNEFSIQSLINADAKHDDNGKKPVKPVNQETQMTKNIWIMESSDPHWGWHSKEFVIDNGKSGSALRFLGMDEAVIEMMRHAKLFENGKIPVHCFVMNDDPTQGNHFQIQQQTHPHKMPYALIEDELRKRLDLARTAQAADFVKIFKETCVFVLHQLQVRGEAWVQDQMEQLLERHLEPNIDFFDALLTRSRQSGLIIRGVSNFAETPCKYDGRDIGFINYGTGNHFGNTVNNELTEGRVYAKILRSLLLSRPNWANQKQLLETFVKAPLYSNQFIGWGTIHAPGKYEWGLEFRDAPTRLTSWGDTLLGAVRNDEKRGNYSRIFEGRVTLKTCGDKHFCGFVRTSHTLYHMAPPGTHTDSFGERGFPPNNTGVSFIGLPVDGPDSGPVLVRALLYDQIKKYFENPYDFNWEEFLPNPA